LLLLWRPVNNVSNGDNFTNSLSLFSHFYTGDARGP
jgi:hypothetical protein